MTGRSKRCRVDPSPRDVSRGDSYHQALTCARVVCRNGPDILRVPHIVDELDQFLDNSCKWTLTKACKTNSLRLIKRILVKQDNELSTSCWHYPEYRQWQFDVSMCEAMEVGNLKIVQLLAMHFQSCRVSNYVVNCAARRGLSEVLEWLLERDYDVQWTTEAVTEAIKNNHFELAKWLKESLSILSEYDVMGWAVQAAVGGDLDMVKWVCEMLTERDFDGKLPTHVNLWGVVQSATNYGHLNVLKWILDEPKRNVLLYELRGLKCEGTFPVKIDLSWAAARGHIDVLTWLTQNFLENCSAFKADYRAAKGGHLDSLRLLFSTPIKKRISSQAIDVAAANGHLDIVRFLLAEGYPLNNSMDNAAENGFLDIVRWLHENTSSSCSMEAMDAAASNGHLDVVEWLHHNREEGCTTRAMDTAASSGHLEMVKWLHFNRQEGCTAAAMDSAAGNGHLDVVKWLHLNRLEGCTTEAMDKAAENNHLEVLKWLAENRTEWFTSDATHKAVRFGNLEVVQWLLSHEAEIRLPAAFNAAACAGRFDVMWFLQRKYDAIEMLKRTMTTVFPFRRLEFAEYAYVHHRKQFELTIAGQLFAEGV